MAKDKKHTGTTIRDILLNRSSVVKVGNKIKNKTVEELMHDAARLEDIRYGEAANLFVEGVTVQPTKTKKQKGKAEMPSRTPEAYKWVKAWWDCIKPMIDEDPSLANDIEELYYRLKSQGLDYSRDTVRKIVDVGTRGEMLTESAFRIKYSM